MTDTTHDTEQLYQAMNNSLVALRDFLNNDGRSLMRFLIEQEVLDHERMNGMLSAMDQIFLWLYARVDEFDQQFATVDAALALTEVLTELVSYITEGLKQLSESVGSLPAGTNLSAWLAAFPTIDLTGITALVRFLPDPTEVAQLKNTLVSIVGTSSLPDWPGSPIAGAIPDLRAELLLISPPILNMNH